MQKYIKKCIGNFDFCNFHKNILTFPSNTNMVLYENADEGTFYKLNS